MTVRPPSPMLADDAIRLVPLTPAYAEVIGALVEDENVRRHTRVPTEPPADFASGWLGTYEEGWRDGSRAGFAIESHDGEFLGLGLFVRMDRHDEPGLRARGGTGGLRA